MSNPCILLTTSYKDPNSVNAQLALNTLMTTTIPIIVADQESSESWRTGSIRNFNVTLLNQDSSDSSRHAGRLLCADYILKDRPQLEAILFIDPEMGGIQTVYNRLSSLIFFDKGDYVLACRSLGTFRRYPNCQQVAEWIGNLYIAQTLYGLGLKRHLLPPY